MAGDRWAEHEENFIKENFIEMSCSEMAKRLGRTTRSVQHKYNQMGLERPEPQPGVYKNNRLFLIDTRIEYKYGQNITIGIFNCDCGKVTSQKLTAVVHGAIKSCGCLKEELASERCKTLSYKHGESSERLFKIWCAMKARCTTKEDVKYNKNWGARGIEVCEEWQGDYIVFKNWAITNGYQSNLSIDRIDVNGNYYPDNCRWITSKVQNNNRRDNKYIIAFGETKTAQEWEEDSRCVCNAQALIYRLFQSKYEWDSEVAITTPLAKTGNRNNKKASQ